MSDTTLMDMVRCDRRGMKLLRAGCARLFLSARDDRPAPWEGRHACIACPDGAANAGIPLDQSAAAAETWRACCDRCLVGGSRLIGRRLCVSCWNRDREAAIGRDRKGHRPRLIDALHVVKITIVRGGIASDLQADRALSAVEVMVAEAKGASTALVFGWRPPVDG